MRARALNPVLPLSRHNNKLGELRKLRGQRCQIVGSNRKSGNSEEPLTNGARAPSTAEKAGLCVPMAGDHKTVHPKRAASAASAASPASVAAAASAASVTAAAAEGDFIEIYRVAPAIVDIAAQHKQQWPYYS